MEENYPCEKLTPKKWIANFWYYHKWLFLAVLVIVIFLLICFFQLIFRADPDITFLYVGPHRVSQNDCDAISQSAASLISDKNGDGEVFVDIRTIELHQDMTGFDQGQIEEAQQAFQAYSNEILGGDACFLLVEEEYYTELSESGALVHLLAIYDELPSSSWGYYGLRLGDTRLFLMDGFSSLSPDLVFCLKFSPATAGFSDEERVRMDEDNLALFAALAQTDQ